MLKGNRGWFDLEISRSSNVVLRVFASAFALEYDDMKKKEKNFRSYYRSGE